MHFCSFSQIGVLQAACHPKKCDVINDVKLLYEQKPPLNAHAEEPSGARGLKFGLRLHLHPYFVYASIKSFEKFAPLHRLTWAFIVHTG